MKASFEIPINHIMQLKEYQDYDYTLAHLALQSEVYRRSYGEGNVLDNGAYELDEPLKVDDLRRAIKLIKPRVVIAPDFLDDHELTLEAFKICSNLFECEAAGVVTGKELEQMEECYRQYKVIGVEIVSLPFRKDRVKLMEVLSVKGDLDRTLWHHWLGLKNMDELKAIKALGLDPDLQSIDTSKPIKAALAGKTIFDDLRGLGKLDMHMTMTPDQVDRCRFNMDRFREECVR